MRKPRKVTIMEFWDVGRNMLQVWWLKKNGTKELLREVHYKEKPWVTFDGSPTPQYRIIKGRMIDSSGQRLEGK
jgi:hypothetical protein